MKHTSRFNIIYEDDHLLALNKPPRLASVPDKKHENGENALEEIRLQYKEKGIVPYPLHRLDYGTSGILLFGKFPRDRTALEAIIKHPATRKTYTALIKGRPRGNEITIPLPSRQDPSKKIPAKTHFRIQKIFPGKPYPLCLVEARIETGRKHQIRRHFAEIGYPIILDQKYGDAKLNRMFRLNFRLGRQFLHAARLQFYHPFLQKTVTLEAPMPPDLKSILKKLG